MSKHTARHAPTYLLLARCTSGSEAIVCDHECREAFIYCLALHANRFRIALHAGAFDQAGFILVCTPPSRRARARFCDNMRRDLAGYLAARFELSRCAFELEAPVALKSAEATLEALAIAQQNIASVLELVSIIGPNALLD